MTRPAGRFLVRQGAGVLLALLAGALFAPPAARASCGDYVVLGDRPAHHGQGLPDTLPAPGNRHAPPCSGPHCSQHRQPLPPAPAAPVPERIDPWGCVPTPLPVPDPDAPRLTADGDGERPVRHARVIYHPPR